MLFLSSFYNKNTTGFWNSSWFWYVAGNAHVLLPDLTHSMVQSPSWAANWFAVSQEIPRISQNPKVHYRTHRCPPPVCILGQPNPVHIPTSHLLEIHSNIIHPSTPRSPQWSLSPRFPHPTVLNRVQCVLKMLEASRRKWAYGPLNKFTFCAFVFTVFVCVRSCCFFIGRFRVSREKRLLTSSCTSVCLPAANTGQMSVKFGIGEFHEKLSTN